jgi:outer membrane protein assembly factor BamB
VDLEDGSITFELALEVPVVAPLYVGDGMLYVADVTGRLWKVDLSTQEIIDTVRLAAGTPVGLTGTSRAVYLVTGEGTLYAVALDTFTKQWNHSVGDVPGGPVAVAEGAVYVSTAAGRLVVLESASGEVSFSTDLGAAVRTGPTVVGGTVTLALASGEILRVDAADGSVRASYGARAAQLAVNEKNTFFAGPGAGAFRDDSLLWDLAPGNEPYRAVLAVGDSVLLLADTKLLARSGDTGEHLFHIELGGRPTGEPVPWVRNGRTEAVLVALRSGALVSVRPGRTPEPSSLTSRNGMATPDRVADGGVADGEGTGNGAEQSSTGGAAGSENTRAGAAGGENGRLLTESSNRISGTVSSEPQRITVRVRSGGSYEFRLPSQEEAPVVLRLENERGAVIGGNLDKPGLTDSFAYRLDSERRYMLLVEPLRPEVVGERYTVVLNLLAQN